MTLATAHREAFTDWPPASWVRQWEKGGPLSATSVLAVAPPLLGSIVMTTGSILSPPSERRIQTPADLAPGFGLIGRDEVITQVPDEREGKRRGI